MMPATHTILVNDFPGYPYPIQLSRELALRGVHVNHCYTPSITTTPTGNIAFRADDPPTLSISPIVLNRPLNKHNLVKRFVQEREYGRRVARLIRRDRPSVVISANCPLDAQATIVAAARSVGAKFVFWLQDLLGVAANRVLSDKLPVVGGIIGRRYERLEYAQLRASEAVVVLSADFVPIVTANGVAPDHVNVIENWAPLDSLPPRRRDNAWSREHGYDRLFTFVYAGSLGMKHNPDLLLQLAAAFVGNKHVRIVVLSQGQGADFLRDRAARDRLTNVDVLPYAPFETMPDVMASADVLVGILEEAAGVYSVPSKVLAYLCSRRPILASIPTANLAARILIREEAGLVVEPTDVDGFVESARLLYIDAATRATLAANGRRYAESTFAIEDVADRFEAVLRHIGVDL